MVKLGDSGKIVMIKAFRNIADRDHEVDCYRKLKTVQGSFVPILLHECCRPPYEHDERRHALMLSWIGPLWQLDFGPFSANELCAVRRDVLRMHALGVVHRDLAPRNLVRDGAGGVFIVDFDMAAVDCEDFAARFGSSFCSDFESECASDLESLEVLIRRAAKLSSSSGAGMQGSDWKVAGPGGALMKGGDRGGGMRA